MRSSPAVAATGTGAFFPTSSTSVVATKENEQWSAFVFDRVSLSVWYGLELTFFPDHIIDLLLGKCRSTLGELIPLLLPHSLIWSLIVPQVLRLTLLDDAYVNITTRTQIVENTTADRRSHKLNSLAPLHILHPSALKDRHSRQTTRTHRNIGQLIRTTMWSNGEQVRSRCIIPSQHQRCTNISLILEQSLLQHCHCCNDAWLTTGVEFVKLHVGRDELSDEFGVCSCTGTAATNVVGDVVDLFTVLVGYDRTFCSTSVCSENYAIFEDASDNGGTGGSGGEATETGIGEEGVT